MRIIDNFLSPDGLQLIKNKCLNSQLRAESFKSFESELFKKCQEVFHGSCIHAMIYRINPQAQSNPHIDYRKWSTVFYPFDSDGGLGIWTDNWKMTQIIKVKENRLVAYESGVVIHSQEPPSKGTRYSVAFHWSSCF